VASAQPQPVNPLGAAVRDANGAPINYGPADFARMNAAARSSAPAEPAQATAPQAFVPATNNAVPFWQYSIFGSGIGASNIIIVPGTPGTRREVILGGNSKNDFGSDDFWQVIQRNATSGNYDQRFVSPIYSSPIKRIALGNVTGDAQQEIVVMLANGLIYYYDLVTRAELGHVTTGVTSTEALSVTDLNGDGIAELIVTTSSDLFVYDNTGNLLWKVLGAGGTDVVAGQMDNDPALEIATTKSVVDSGTHAVQWTRNGGFGAHVKLAPFAGATYQQLIAADAWSSVYSYDVATQLPRWSISTPQDIGAIAVADVDNDGTPELLIGDGQWGKIHVYNLVTQALKWEANNPEHGITNIAADDVDGDGVIDLLWGAGWTSTGADYFYVADTTGTHAIKWQSTDLEGPFLGPFIADLDGDGKQELVISSTTSASGYSGPRILVFDYATLALRAISSPTLVNSFGNANDMKVRDLEGDGRAEIVIATSNLYDGVIDVITFDSSNVFTLKWTNPTPRPSGSPFNFVEIADLDGNGTSEIIAGNSVATTGSDGVFVYIYDYPSTAAPWRSVKLASNFASMKGLVVGDLDGNGSKDFAALISTGDLYTFDGPTRTLKNLKQATSATLIADRRTPAGLLLGDPSGVGHFWNYNGTDYAEDAVRQLGSAALTGLTVSSDGSLWIGDSGRLKLRLPTDYRGVWWQSPVFGTGFGRYVATDVSNSQKYVFSSAKHAVAGFEFTPTTPTPETVLGNLSTRLHVDTGDNVLIGGFIVGGAEPKKLIVRALGPSLSNLGVTTPLANPTLELHGPSGIIASNDDWVSSPDKQAIIDSTVAPTNDLESAIVATLPANNTAYTAIVRGVNGSTGIGVVEVYDISSQVEAKMVNIATRGFVDTGDNVLFGGMIVVGPNSRKVIIRAIGPSLPVQNRLWDPTLELRDAQGALIEANDNWQDSPNKQAILDSTIPPTNPYESAIVATLPGNNATYTAVVRGTNGTTGIAVVEVYSLEQ
jgi:hypothetical protein